MQSGIQRLMTDGQRRLSGFQVGRAHLDQDIGATRGDHLACRQVAAQTFSLGIYVKAAAFRRRQQPGDIQPVRAK